MCKMMTTAELPTEGLAICVLGRSTSLRVLLQFKVPCKSFFVKFDIIISLSYYDVIRHLMTSYSTAIMSHVHVLHVVLHVGLRGLHAPCSFPITVTGKHG